VNEKGFLNIQSYNYGDGIGCSKIDLDLSLVILGERLSTLIQIQIHQLSVGSLNLTSDVVGC
jgi:hypothetical protein